jgi:hypothetical protein
MSREILIPENSIKFSLGGAVACVFRNKPHYAASAFITGYSSFFASKPIPGISGKAT